MILSIAFTVKLENFVADDGFFTASTIVAGVASALAVAVLGATPPNSSPSFQYVFNRSAKPSSDKRKEILTSVYLGIWIVIGVAAVFTWALVEPNPNALGRAQLELSSFGKTWLGMAVSSTFAYLGISGQN